PKSLLRHPEATSTLDDLADGYFLPILEDPSADPDRVRRIVLCSGKVYYDLIAAREASGEDRLAILRVEQLYPFREDVLAEELACYPEAEEIYWCQEEPRNMGAWSFVAPLIHELSELPLRYVGRDRAASPATGSKHLHDQEQKALVLSATEIA
ncbi:MAG: 2-oxoglutarate dehydrogenase E1 component, partial [Deltaproteobacteria bacterium]|nr:2-oxoglutarate dehydrogenase E1 component [Deltaproteobacteria bacterium]